MSNPGQAITAVVGGVIGFAVGGPTGAAWGFQLGLAAGQLISPTSLPPVTGPRLEDYKTTTAELGGAIPITYGTIAVPGTVMWLAPVEEVKTQTRQGRGKGQRQTVTTYEYFQSIAIGLCEGPIGGVLRIWENGKLVYDIRPIQDTETGEEFTARRTQAAEYALNFVLYLGSETQEPDPTIEEVHGVDNVPAFRGLAYIVFPRRKLTDDQGYRHPQWRIEVYHEGQREQEVWPPINLVGAANNVQNDALAVMWDRDRYATWDRTHASPDQQWLRLYSIQNPQNTELLSRSVDVGYPEGTWGTRANEDAILYQIVAGADGYWYVIFDWDYGSDASAIYKLARETFDIVDGPYIGSTFYLATFAAGCALVTRTLPTRTANILVNVSILSNRIEVFDTTGTMRSLLQANLSQDLSHICIGPETDGSRTFYLLSYSNSVATDPCKLYRIVVTIPPLDPITGEPVLVASYEFIRDVTCAQMYAGGSPSATRWWNEPTGLYMDPADGGLVFGWQVGFAGSSAGSQSRYIKIDPDTAETVWLSDALTQNFDLANIEVSAHQSVVDQRRLLITEGTRYTAYLNMATGVIDYANKSDWLNVPDYEQMTFHNAFHNSLGLIIHHSSTYDAHEILVEGGVPTDCVTLAEIVTDVCERCNLTAAEIDVSDLDICIHGYAVMQNMPGRQAIEVLRPIGPFDAVESADILKFPTRGKAIVATLDEDDLGAHVGDSSPPAVTTRKTQDVELPRQLRLSYIAHTRDYETGEQISPMRLETDAVNDVNLDIPAAFLTDQQAARCADITWADAWQSRWTHEIALDQSWTKLEPTDAIGVPIDGRVERCRIVSIDETLPHLRKLTLVRDDDGSFNSYAIAPAPMSVTTRLSFYARSTMVLLDLPALEDGDNNAGFYVAAAPDTAGQAWVGARVYRTYDGGTSYLEVAAVTRATVIGTIVDDVAEGITTTWDYGTTITVDVPVGELSSVESGLDLFVGANAAAIGAHGRWEVVQFRKAELISPNRWELSELLRGRRGTEHNVGSTLAGDTFVLLSGDSLARANLQTSEIGMELGYKISSIKRVDENEVDQNFTGAGEALKPFSVQHVAGTRDGSNNLTITWIRRGRLGQELRDGADIPLSEETESYEVDIMRTGSPSGVARTLSVTAQTATYTAAQATADGNSPSGPVVVRIYQLSAIVGRGHVAEATL